MIQSKEVSVVVQGPIVEKYTKKCLRALRKALPESEIILSTWKGTDCTGLLYDKLVLSKDPGAFYLNEYSEILNNTNRQLVSTQAGIACSTKPYILKIRSDLIMTRADFLQHYISFDGLGGNRLVVSNYYTRNPRVVDFPYHISDWIVFGKENKIRTYFDIPLLTKEECLWFKTHQKDACFMKNMLCKYTAEQHLGLCYLHKKQDVDCKNYYDNSYKNRIETEQLLARDFIVLDYQRQWKVLFPKYNPNRYFDHISLVSHQDWLTLYDHYCAKKSKFILWQVYCVRSFIRRLLYCLAYISVTEALSFLGIKRGVQRWLDRIG